MIFPTKLDETDLIGIVAPASCDDKCIIDKKLNILDDIGLKYKTGKYIYNSYGYLAGTDYERSVDFMNMVSDKSIKAIMCLRGGYGCMRILPYLDYKIIKKNPKIIIGYSDLTVLLNHISSKCNLVTYHGPMVNSNLNDIESLNSLCNQLFKDNKTIFNFKDYSNIYFYNNNNSIIEGKLVGGNLSMICSSLATPYEIDTKNSILLLEDIGEVPYKIDRMLTQLILANKFKSVKAIILGHFTNCDPPNLSRSFSLKDTLLNILSPLKIPILFNFPCGHDYPNYTLPIGSNIIINIKDKSIYINN